MRLLGIIVPPIQELFPQTVGRRLYCLFINPFSDWALTALEFTHLYCGSAFTVRKFLQQGDSEKIRMSQPMSGLLCDHTAGPEPGWVCRSPAEGRAAPPQSAFPGAGKEVLQRRIQAWKGLDSLPLFPRPRRKFDLHPKVWRLSHSKKWSAPGHVEAGWDRGRNASFPEGSL